MKRRQFIRALNVMVLSISLVACCATLQLPSRPTPTVRVVATAELTRLPTAAKPAGPTLTPRAAANELELQLETVFEQASPSVVNVTSQVIGGNLFMQAVPQEGTGSGFVYDNEGHIVTNYHVVEGAESVSVSFASGESYPAAIVGEDPSTDLAVLKVDAPHLPDALPVSDSSQLRVGQFVVAIGNPFRLDRTLTFGIISALQRVIESPDGRFIGEAIQTDAAVNPGNSGGPLLDLDGQVVGVNSQIVGVTGANVGIGFAIASNTVSRVVPELIARGSYPHPWLGVTITTITPDGAEALRDAGAAIGADEGLLVMEVVERSPAAVAGLRGGDRVIQLGQGQLRIGGDIITAIDGRPVQTTEDLTLYLDASTRVGDTVELTIVRDTQELVLHVTLAERPETLQ
jgi:S1-C subfamily serine protease